MRKKRASATIAGDKDKHRHPMTHNATCQTKDVQAFSDLPGIESKRNTVKHIH